MNDKIIAMIPARIGSTRLKFKNLSLINNKPMIYYAINSAKKSQIFDNIYLNSDHIIFKEIAKRYHVDFYLRSKSLGKNNVRSDDIVYNFLINNYCDVMCWINPIAPLLSSNDIKNTINYFLSNNLDSLITTEEKNVHSIYNNKPINYVKKRKFDLTQNLKPIKLFNYSIMMWRTKTYIKNYKKNKYSFFCGNFDTYNLSKFSSLIVKNSEDLHLVNYVLKQRNRKIYPEIKYDKILKKL